MTNQLNRHNRNTQIFARFLMCLVFLMNGFGIIDQTEAAKELAATGIAPALVPFLMLLGRGLEIVGGLALASGVYPRLGALAVLVFLIPATFIGHAFWLSTGTPAFVGQLINFLKNVAIWGGLLFIAANRIQPSLTTALENEEEAKCATTPATSA